MNKLTLIALLLFYASFLYAQQNILVLKKGEKTIDRFWPGSVIAFQLQNGQWQKGALTRIQNDSFYIRPMLVRYSLSGADTVHFSTAGFAFTDVAALPKKGFVIDYIDGWYQVSKSAGHVHWYWIKSGWVFRVAPIGYAALDATNGLIKKDYSFKGSKLGIAAGAFLAGVLLKHTYKYYRRLGKKYHFEMFSLSK